ncbi:phage tail tape measure protein [Streptomyces sp. NPDC090057]|uniref:phage tail tape measure protein n=1 Tax=Streptomyces sp. NPDC090057 TaxID=3365935 RepID=UPI0038231EC5
MLQECGLQPTGFTGLLGGDGVPTVGYATLQIMPSVRGISADLQRQLVDPAAEAGQRAGEAAGGGLKDKLKLGAAGAAVAAGALLVKGISDAMGQADVTRTLQAQLGASSKDAARYGKVAGQLYSSGVTGSFEDAADAIKSVMQSGIAPPKATNKQLESIATKASDVANVFGQDMPAVTNAAAQAIRTGLVKNSSQAFDLITAGFQGGADKAGDFLDTINEYGTQFRKAGLDGATAVGLINQGLKAGARDGDLVADSIKEFSIRAVDGSKTTEQGFKALGLNADQMAAKFGKGGKSASAALDTTLDRLRGIKDPVKQSQAAVALFGTQAEDLGQALFALDPSKAAKGLGKVGGAAKKVGDTVRSGPSYEIQTFTRRLQQGFVDIVGGIVLPVVKDVVSWLSDHLGPAISGISTAVSGTIGWFKEWGVWLAPLAILIGGIALALGASAIAAGIASAATAAWATITGIAEVVTGGWAAAMGVLNAVMALNPFVLVAIAVAALVAAIVIAYNKSETFRQIVQAAWQGIKTAALYVWNSVLKPAFAGLVAGLSALGAAFSWLWSVVIKPTFSFISTAARILATILTIVVLGPIILAVKALASIFTWLWTNAISPAIGWIVAGFKLWWSGAKVIFGYFTSGLRAIGRVAVWLWTNAVSPMVGWVVAGFRSLWSGAKVIFGYFTTGLRTLASWARWLWTNGVKPAFSGIASTISTVYSAGIKPVFDKLRSAVGQVGKAFSVAKDAIRVAWDKVKGIAKAPVVFVVNTVYGKLRGVWNTVAGAFGAPKLPAYKFATGGILPGYTPGRDVHLAALSGGEAIMRPEWTRAVGPGYVHSMNAAARTGGVTGVQRALGLPAFADGGIFGWVKSAASKGYDLGKSGVNWLKDGVKASALSGLNSVVKPLIAKISGSASLYRDMITRVPKKMISTIVDFSDKADKKLGDAGIGGKGFKSALSWARAQAGKPYIWGGVGPQGFDCSGFMGALENVIRGQAPNRRRWATGAFSGAHAPAGWVRGARSPFQIGITNAGVGHTAGTLNGVNVESRGGDGVVVGAGARGYNASLFTDRYGFKGYAAGGSPRPGEIAWVGENGPELIRFSGGEVVYSHSDSMRMAAGMGGIRGFAKGTTARKQVPGDLTSFTKSLHGSAADISKAAKELAKDLKAAGGAGKGLAASTSKTNAKLQALAKKRDAVASKLATARQAAADQRQTASDYLSLSNQGDATSVNGLIKSMQQRQSNAKAFQSSIKTLQKKGLSQSLIQQLVAMGPDSQLAGLVATSGSLQIHQLNKLAKSGTSLASSYGNTMADAMYDSGKNASKGFLTGLVSQEKELQAAMDKLASSLVKSIKKKLKIKSPSRVTHALGAYTGQGFAIGLDSTASQVAAAASRVSRAAVPAVPATGRAAAGAGAFTVEVHTKDEALAEFVEVRIRDNNGRILTGLNARPRG